jgi:hypothetical protein
VKAQTLFSGKWIQTSPLMIAEPTQPELCGTQPQAFKALKDKQHVILNAPTGWGKSVVIAFLVACKLLRNPQLRCIIAVPQTVIARGFVKDWKLRVAGKLVDWVVQHNLCHAQATNTIACLIQFLRGDHISLGDQCQSRQKRGPLSRREGASSAVARWGAGWNRSWPARAAHEARGGVPGRVESQSLAESQRGMM